MSDFLHQHRRLGLDTPVFVYHYERAPEYLPATRALFRQMAAGAVAGVTSTVTLTEVTVRPIAQGQRALANQYLAVLTHFPNLTMIDVNPVIARQAAELRAHHRIRTIDALQIATALTLGATGFVTNDRRLRAVDAIDVLVLADAEDVAVRG